jgi:hypothetical protein
VTDNRVQPKFKILDDTSVNFDFNALLKASASLNSVCHLPAPYPEVLDDEGQGISLSDLNASTGLLHTDIDQNFSFTSFGFDDDNVADNSHLFANEDKKLKLLEKCREPIRKLAAYLSVHDPSKMLNILVMNQQLNIITTPTLEEVQPPLKKKKRNLKVCGVMTTDEVLEKMEKKQKETENDEKEREIELIGSERHDLEIKSMENELKTARDKLKKAKDEKTRIRKENFGKKKIKNLELKAESIKTSLVSTKKVKKISIKKEKI